MENISIVDIVSLAISIAAAVFAVFTFWSNVIHDRKKATLEAYNILQEQALDKLYVYPPAKIKEIIKDKRSEEYKQIGVYVARIEHFAVGVEQKLYDWKVVYELSHGFLDGSIKSRIDIVINEKDKKFEGNFYRNIRVLYKRMDEETKRRNNG